MKNLVKLTAPEGATSVHHDGEDYEVKNGVVGVPAEIAGDLIAAHDYSVHKGLPKQEKKV